MPFLNVAFWTFSRVKALCEKTDQGLTDKNAVTTRKQRAQK